MSSEYFTDYLDEIGKLPLLAREREIELGQIIQRGLAPSASRAEMEPSQEARTELARHSLRLVVSIAHRFRDPRLDLEELTFAGNVGLIEATKRFNGGEFRARFSTYAVFWIQMKIRDALWRARLIRTPVRHERDFVCGKTRLRNRLARALSATQTIVCPSMPLTSARQVLGDPLSAPLSLRRSIGRGAKPRGN